MTVHECIKAIGSCEPTRMSRIFSIAALLLLPAAALFGQQEEPVSRADYQEMREEIDALRAEVERLQERDAEGETVHSSDTALPIEPPRDVAAWGRALTFTSPDERFSLNIRGRIQPRYEYERREGDSDHSSFSLRRLRLTFEGHAYTPDLTWKIMPEWSRGASLRDGFANYRFNDFAQVRLGQYQVPFAWERDSSSTRHQFVERSTANNVFQWNDGRDLGLMLHGNLHEQLRYAVGVFGGEGRERSATRSTGNLYTGRLTYTPIGTYPGSEALLQPVEGANLAFGIGLGTNTKNTPRDDAWQDANVLAATADTHLQVNRISAHLSGFYRDVNPRNDDPSYDGTGYTVQAGYLLVPDRLFASLRYSYAKPNSDVSEDKEREVMAGLQIYHFGHGSKIHLEAGRAQIHNGNEWLDTDIIRTQYQLLF